MKLFLLAVLVVLSVGAASVMADPSEQESVAECYPGGWPLLILPIEVGADSAHLPFSTVLLQDKLSQALLEYSPFTHIEAEVTPGHAPLGPGWFYLRAEVTGRSGTGYDVKADREFNLRVTVWAGGDLAHVFQRQYRAVHETSRPAEGIRSPGHASAGTATSQHIIGQWTSSLLPDLIDFFSQDAWEYATKQWKAHHESMPVLFMLLPDTAGTDDESLWSIVAQTLGERGCAQVDILRSNVSQERLDSAFASRGEIARSNQYLLNARTQNYAGGLSLNWQLRRRSTGQVVLTGTTKPARQRWQIINSARALAARIGIFLHPVPGINSVE